MWTLQNVEKALENIRLGRTGPNRFDDIEVWFSDMGLYVYGDPPEKMVPHHVATLKELGWEYTEDPGGEKAWYIYRRD